MGTFKNVLYAAGVKGMVTTIVTEFALTFGKQILAELRSEHEAMRLEFGKSPTAEMASA